MPQLNDIIRTKILDFQEKGPENTYAREVQLPILVDEIVSIYGMRRSGKTSLMQRTISLLERDGVARNQILWLSLEDDRLEPLSTELLQNSLDIHFSIFPGSIELKRYLFFDEIQEVPLWEKFIRRLSDDKRNKIFISGSSAKMLSEEIHTSLRGRSLGVRVFPLAFREVLNAKGIDYTLQTTKVKALIQNAFDEYFDFGGFPAVLALPKQFKPQQLSNYVEVTLLRDIIERHDVSHPSTIRFLTLTLMRSMSNQLSVNKLNKSLQSNGFRIGIATLHDYFSYFESACLISSVKLFTDSVRKQNVNPRKVYLADHALARNFAPSYSENRGYRLENIVAVELLRRKNTELYYYKTRSSYEVDFVTLTEGKIGEAIQVSETLLDSKTRERELRALFELLEELELRRATVITMSDNPETVIGPKNTEIVIVPILKWLQA